MLALKELLHNLKDRDWNVNPTYKIDVNEARRIIEGIEAVNKWIPVSERLPEDNKTVIASTKYGVYPETSYEEGYGWEWAYEAGADYWESLEGVMAWMPLPEPYKAESEE